MAKKITWLASYPKSGNTWARLFLSAYFTGKSTDLNHIGHVLGDHSKYFHQTVSPKPIEDLSEGEYALVHGAALLHYSESHLPRPLILKTHNANATVLGVAAQPEQVTEGAIYLVRDPRDVAISYADHMGSSIDEAIEKMGNITNTLKGHNMFPHFLGTWSMHYASWVREKKFPVVVYRYEDMLEDPVGVFSRMLQRMNQSVDEDRVKQAVEQVRFDKMQALEQETGFCERLHQEKFFARGTSGHWRDILTTGQIKKIEKDHKDVMVSIGYKLHRNLKVA